MKKTILSTMILLSIAGCDSGNKPAEATKHPAVVAENTQATTSASNKIGQDTTQAWDKTKEVSNEAVDKVKNSSSDAWDKTKEVSSEAADKVKSSSSNAWDKTKEVSSEAVDKVESAF